MRDLAYDLYCMEAPRGWRCTRTWMHEGPCAAVPRWWNLPDRWRYRRATREIPYNPRHAKKGNR